MTMGFEGDGDPPTGIAGEVTDIAEVTMDLEEALDAVTGQLLKNSGRSSLPKKDARSTTGKTTTTTSHSGCHRGRDGS
jgi:hypothetical protein